MINPETYDALVRAVSRWCEATESKDAIGQQAAALVVRALIRDLPPHEQRELLMECSSHLQGSCD